MAPTLDYRRRIVDDELDFLLENLFAVAIDGPKAVGKTATAERRAATTFRLDTDPLDIVESGLARLASAPEPILIDEWQHWPPAWDHVRRAVDEDPRPGRFILTGSTSLRNPQTHSGAGRIVSLRMRPLTLPERGFATPTVSLGGLLAEAGTAVDGDTALALGDYTEQIVGGGFPGMQTLTPRAKSVQLDSYVQRIVERDFPEAGREVRNPAGLLRWMRAFAAATSTTATFETIRDTAAAGHANPPARSTTIPYRDTLENIWISDPVPGWLPLGVTVERLTEAPKHNLADPALAAALLSASVDDLLAGGPATVPVPRDGHLLGALFESLVALSLRVFAQAAGASVAHLRTKSAKHEIDFIVTSRNHRSTVAVEVKLAPTVKPDDVRHLHWLKGIIGDELTDMVVINTGRYAYRRQDGVAVVPLALLGP